MRAIRSGDTPIILWCGRETYWQYSMRIISPIQLLRVLTLVSLMMSILYFPLLTEEGVECPHCERIFKNQYMLEEHVHIHTGEKRYKCEMCEKLYSTRESLRSHMKGHQFQFGCEICAKPLGSYSAFMWVLQGYRVLLSLAWIWRYCILAITCCPDILLSGLWWNHFGENMVWHWELQIRLFSNILPTALVICFRRMFPYSSWVLHFEFWWGHIICQLSAVQAQSKNYSNRHALVNFQQVLLIDRICFLFPFQVSMAH